MAAVQFVYTLITSVDNHDNEGSKFLGGITFIASSFLDNRSQTPQ
jgi:hypothetical protein